MQVCITGGTGFIGRALLRQLLAEGTPVRALARPSRRADQLEAWGARVVRGELGNPEAVASAVKGADIVYHVAAKVDSPGTKAEFFETNVGGTERVLAASLQQNVGRVIYISSLAVYGPVRNGQRINEDTSYDEAPQKRDFYSHSKILADESASSFARKTGLPVVIIRPGIVYGPGKPLPLGLLGFHLGGINVVLGNRNRRVPLNYIENLIDAVQLVSHLQGEGLRQFNIVDDDTLTLAQYHETRTEVEKKRTLFLPGWPLLAAAPFARALSHMLPLGHSNGFSQHHLKRALQDRWYDTRRIREETGWAPKVQLREALQRTLRSVDG
jgi:2-alkyl-3-oxoalkanoate reductase